MDQKYRIRFKNSDEAKEFVKLAETFDFDIDISYNRVTVDAKSVLGVFSLDFTKVLTVEWNVKDERLEKELQKYGCL